MTLRLEKRAPAARGYCGGAIWRVRKVPVSLWRLCSDLSNHPHGDCTPPIGWGFIPDERADPVFRDWFRRELQGKDFRTRRSALEYLEALIATDPPKPRQGR